MIRRLLIVRGVRTTDDLQALGMPMAQRYDNADLVALIGADNKGLMMKGTKETMIVEFVDADPVVGRCMRAVRRVKDEAEAASGERDLEMSMTEIIGMFLYFWPVDMGSVDVVSDAIEQGDADAVEAAADAFIQADFGANLPALGTLPANDSSSDAAGHAADGAPS